MLKEDIQKYNSRVTSRGFLYLIGLTFIVAISSLKMCVMIIHDIHHLKNKEELPMTSLFKNSYADHKAPVDRLHLLLSVETNFSVEKRMATPDNEMEIIAKNKALATLRDYFLTHNYLEGDIFQTKFSKVSYEELYASYKTGADCKPYFVQNITFGKSMDILLHEAFGYTLKMKKLTKQTYLVFNDGETFELEQTLQRMYYNDKIYLKLTDKEEPKPCNRKKKVLK